MGYAPGIINADTDIIFDITPREPGLDLHDNALKVSVRIFHYAPTLLRGTLLWGWKLGEEPSGSQEIEINSFEISGSIELTSSVPENWTGSGKFFVWLTGENNIEIASGFLDIDLVATNLEATPALAN